MKAPTFSEAQRAFILTQGTGGMPMAATPTSSRWCFPDHQLKFMTARIAPKDANVGVFSGFFPE